MKYFRPIAPVISTAILLLVLRLSLCTLTDTASTGQPGPIEVKSQISAPAAVIPPLDILVDDFEPQPYQGQALYYYNRLDGDRGALNDSVMVWGQGVVTATIAPGRDWGGIWMSLNHPAVESLPVNFSTLLPPAIQPAYQSQVTNLTVLLASGSTGKNLKLELKNGSAIAWQSQGASLAGGSQTLSYNLPALGDITQLVIVLDQAAAGDYVAIDEITLEATTSIADTAEAAFVWSYAMLLNNWNPATGLIRDNGKFPSGVFEAVQSTGSLAAATAQAYQLGILDRSQAAGIINTISSTLLVDLPRYHGLWPHWVVEASGTFTIVQNTEWSSVDTVIAALGLLDAQVALEMDTSGTEQMLQAIDWNGLKLLDGISHGYHYSGSLITSTWDTFGGESWLVDLAYAAAVDEIPPLQYPLPPTANGSGFIDELAWLFLPPPGVPDAWGVDWAAYRQAAAITQTTYYTQPTCFAQLGLFGLSAGEVPMPSDVQEQAIYQAFGAGGRFSPPNDGTALLGAPVVVPHYAAMIASLQPVSAAGMWSWMINDGKFSPLNNIESLLFPSGSACTFDAARWNQLKGSWNLALQTLGWGRYLAERSGKTPALFRAVFENRYLQGGYSLLVPGGIRTIFLPLAVK